MGTKRPSIDDYMTVPKATVYLGIPKATLYHRVKYGELKSDLIDDVIVILKQDLKAYKKSLALI